MEHLSFLLISCIGLMFTHLTSNVGSTKYQCINDYATLYCRPPSTYCCPSKTYTYGAWHSGCCSPTPSSCVSDPGKTQTCSPGEIFCCPNKEYALSYTGITYKKCCSSTDFFKTSPDYCMNDLGKFYCYGSSTYCCPAVIYSDFSNYQGCCTLTHDEVIHQGGIIAAITIGATFGGIILLVICCALCVVCCCPKTKASTPPGTTDTILGNLRRQGQQERYVHGIANPAVANTPQPQRHTSSPSRPQADAENAPTRDRPSQQPATPTAPPVDQTQAPPPSYDSVMRQDRLNTP